MRSICHLVLSTLLIAIAAAPTQADVVSVTFGGTWIERKPQLFFPSLGVIQRGDPFSGAATWDTGAPGALLSFSFTMPAADGLSFASIPNPQVLSAFADVSFGKTTVLQWKEQSTADNNIYAFFIAIPARLESAQVSSPSLDAFNLNLTFFGEPSFTTGPTPVPEPSTIGFLAGGLGLMWLVRRRARK